MKWKNWLAAAVATTAYTAALASGPGYLGAMDNTSIDIGATHGSIGAPFNGAFADTYTFDLLGLGELVGGVHSTQHLPFGIKGLKVSVSGGSLLSPQVFPMLESTGTIDFWVGNLTPGRYTLTVSGKVFGDKGSYGGDFAALTTPVPEPGVWALSLAGLACVGVFASRRRA